jgi:adenosylmethionine-8-amino-7-oxononanoate aminotransferase
MVCLGPPFVVTAEHIATMAEVLAGAIDEVCR